MISKYYSRPGVKASDVETHKPRGEGWGAWRTQETQEFCQSISHSEYSEQHWWAKLTEASGSKTSTRPLSPIKSLVLRLPSSSCTPTAKTVFLTLVRHSPAVSLSVSHTNCGCHPAVPVQLCLAVQPRAGQVCSPVPASRISCWARRHLHCCTAKQSIHQLLSVPGPLVYNLSWCVR